MEVTEIFNSFGYPVAISIVFFIWLFKLVNKQIERGNEIYQKLIDTHENTIKQQNLCQTETNQILQGATAALTETSKTQVKFADALFEFSKSQQKFADALLEFSQKENHQKN